MGEVGIQHDVLAEHARNGGLDVGVEGRVEFVDAAVEKETPAE